MADRACARMGRTSSPIRAAVTAHAVQRTDGKRRERGIGKEQAADVAVIPSTAKDLLRQQSGKIPRCARDDSEEQLAHFESGRSEEHTSELQSLMRISYAVFCLKKKKKS